MRRKLNRRDLLKFLGATPLLPMLYGAVPGNLRAHAEAAPSHATGNRVLVLVELRGGNDGLATVIPYKDPGLRKLRPNLMAAQESVLPVGNDLAFHPALEPLMPAWNAGDLAVVLGVGYPNPNRSHFRSIEIWETGSASDELLTEGWVAAALGGGVGAVADGIVIGGDRAGPLAGSRMRNLMMERPEQFIAQARRLKPVIGGSEGALGHILRTRRELVTAAGGLEDRLQPLPEKLAEFPKTVFGAQVKTAARLILSDIKVPVLKLGIGSFDTHTNQRGTHDRLLEQLAAGLQAFREAMRTAGRWDDVLIMTYSEFGRRVRENASRGTDHGTTAPQFLIGGAVTGGLHATQPEPEDVDRDNPDVRVDFRNLYDTLASEWWGIASVRDRTTEQHPLRIISPRASL